MGPRIDLSTSRRAAHAKLGSKKYVRVAQKPECEERDRGGYRDRLHHEGLWGSLDQGQMGSGEEIMHNGLISNICTAPVMIPIF